MFPSYSGKNKKNNVDPKECLNKMLEVIPDYKVAKLHEQGLIDPKDAF